MRNTEAALMRQPTIYVVDSDIQARQQIEHALNTRGGCTESYDSFVDFLKELRPERAGVAIIDLNVRVDESHSSTSPIPHYGGLAALRKLVSFPYPPPVILLAENPCWRVAVESMKLGCLDILSKPIEPYRLLEAVSHALQRFHATWQRLDRKRGIEEKLSRLTASEREVLNLLCEGYLNKQIASRLSLSIRTIELRRAKILTKMEVTSLGRLIQMVASVDRETRAVG